MCTTTFDVSRTPELCDRPRLLLAVFSGRQTTSLLGECCRLLSIVLVPLLLPAILVGILCHFFDFWKEMHLFILLLSMIVMSHRHQYSIRFELRYNILVHVCISQLSESAVILGCMHVLESELKVDITSCRNEDKSSRTRFKCMLTDLYHFSLYKEYRNRHFRTIS